MKKLLIILFSIIPLLGFIGCSDNDNDENVNNDLFIGKWTSERYYEERWDPQTRNLRSLASVITLTLREDQSFLQKATIDFYDSRGHFIKTVPDSTIREGSYSIDSKLITLINFKTGGRTFFQYKFEDDNMKIKTAEIDFWVTYFK